MNNIIFLDFDGVINNNIDEITLESIIVLRYIIKKYNAKVVVISSELQTGTRSRKDKLRDKLNKLGIFNIDFIDPNFEGVFYNKKLSNRTLGIINYLRKHSNVKYIILDDEYDKEYQLLGLNYFKTKMWEGLKYDDYYEIKFELVNLTSFSNVLYHYRELSESEKAIYTLIRVLKLRENKEV